LAVVSAGELWCAGALAAVDLRLMDLRDVLLLLLLLLLLLARRCLFRRHPVRRYTHALLSGRSLANF
jgi:hypothetical protein